MHRLPSPRFAAAALLIAALATAHAQDTPIPVPKNEPYLGTIRLEVDATDVERHLVRVREQVPVRPGPLVLLYPRFLPGTHGPSGAFEKIGGLKLSAGGKPLPWRRDAVDAFAVHVAVPPAVSVLEVSFEYLSPVAGDSGRVVMTSEMLNAQWIALALYPGGTYSSQIPVQASLRLPAGWRQASALPVERISGQDVLYKPVSLETLVDSPVFAGRCLRRVELEPAGSPRPVALNIVADEAAQLELSEEQLQAHRNLVVQADRLYGARHFSHYEILLALTERMGGIGLEHHESSENGVGVHYFKDWAKRPNGRDLLPHEYTHSWNGKFRRPADLWTPSFEVPMRNSLLWVYEGQTEFWGRVLAARSGLVSIEQTHDELAQAAAWVSVRAGRDWRSLQDTTNEALLHIRAAKDWNDYQRSYDYYGESTFLWLDADTLIRELSGETRSLDDFARAFFGAEPGRVQPLLYTFDDVVAALNTVWPYDWRSFLRSRLDATGSGATGPLDGLRRAGWKLAWAETASDFQQNKEEQDKRGDDFFYSLGFNIKGDGAVQFLRWDSPAMRAGIVRATTVVAVNGRAFKGERLAAAVTANKSGAAPLLLLLKDGDAYRSVTIDYRGGLRYPRLERISDSKERLDAGILAARP